MSFVLGEILPKGSLSIIYYVIYYDHQKAVWVSSIMITIKGRAEEGAGSNAQGEVWDFINCVANCGLMLMIDINSKT